MQTSTEYLYQILQVVGRIDQTMRKESGGADKKDVKLGGERTAPKTSIFKGVGMQLKQMFSVNYKGSKSFFTFTNKLLDLADKTPDKNIDKLKVITDSFNGLASSLPKLTSSLQELAKVKEKRINMAINNLGLLYEFMHSSGDGRKIKRVEKAIRTFHEMAIALKEIAKPIKTISMSLINLSLGIVAFAAAILVSGKLLGAAGAGGVITAIVGIVLGLVTVFGVLALAKKVVKDGQTTLKDIGLGMTFLALGMVSFALAINILPSLLNTSTVMTGVLMVAGIIVMSGLLFAGIGLLDKWIEKGVGVAVSMGVGMMALAAGVLIFALVARLITGLGDKDAKKKDGTERSKFGKAFAGMGPGLGVMGVILVGSALLFAGMGALAVVILPGIGVGITMALGMIVLAAAVKKVVNTSKELEGVDVKESVGGMISGVLEGFLAGIKTLAGGKAVGEGGIKNFIKNSATLFAGVGVLMSVSIALSMFAKSLTAFAEFENMRVIEGTDKDGKPIFGDRVNVKSVADNVAYSIGTFLTTLITSTEGLTTQHSKALRKMGRALTGRRGILSAVNQFSEILKTFAQFGPEGKIGFVDMVPDGVDEDGNAKFKQVASTVLITEVVDNIVSSFGKFVSDLTDHSKDFEVTGKHGRRMSNLAEVLLGRKGIGGREKYGLLQPINAFAETLMIYSKFGADNMIPNIDAEGKVIGEPIPVTTIADNIMSTLGAFTDALGAKKLNKDTKDAEKNLKTFDNIIDRTNKIAKSVDGLTRLSATLTEFANSIGLLSTSLAGLDVSKISDMSDIGAAYLKKTNDYSVSNKRIMESYAPNAPAAATTTAATPSTSSQERRSGTTTTKAVEPNWDNIAAQIGQSVGSQLVAAMKSGQMKFEFSPSSSNSGVIEFG